ncbi:hypothetical protein [Paludisphaera mucosa]|uniref:Glycoside hydrolase family 5 domain-containing protein n=1 Tax=Paludisphaera mucosa TaxID=3030827 RepID=A0ABT6FKK0_9BACT|nr:hypothetical protein [Paludisphaera mucosa]MDG3008054.1 hypothetical protein [Paludisphaera mucosa]
MRTTCLGVAFSLTLVLDPFAAAQEPYADPAQLDVPWPKHSFVKVPWRGFLETKPGDAFLRGIGVNYNVPGESELAVRLLAEAGFKTFRIEVGWGSVRWDEQGLEDPGRLRWLLGQCRRRGIRPTFLLNAHQGVPCPHRDLAKRLKADAPAGAREVVFEDVADVVVGRTGLNNLTDYWAAEALIVKLDAATGVCTLSKPLPKPLKRGDELRLTTLKHPPLHPVGTPEFDETAAGWARYAGLVADEARRAGIAEFDLEIWNELTFGTRFLDVAHYHERPVASPSKDALHAGGPCWELAARTVAAVRREHPGARCIWGFSNTTFFHTKVEELPPGIDGQSYHPYGTGTRRFPDDEDYRDRPEFNVDGHTPTAEFRVPEGWAHTFAKTESLMRLLNPEARRSRPPETARFFHYITEHGVLAQENGVRDVDAAWRLKTLCVLRSSCLWLNKGVDVLHYFSAFDADPLEFGLLPPDLAKLPADAAFDAVATPPLRALRNLTRAFEGSEPLAKVDALQVAVAPLDGPYNVFDAPRPLRHQDVFAFLPFQATPNRHVVAVYVSTYDANQSLAEERYRLSIRGFASPPRSARLLDPVAGRTTEVRLLAGDPPSVDLEVPVVDYPRLLILE